MTNLNDEAVQYANQILTGKIPACETTILACERFKKDLERQATDEFPYFYDLEEADAICHFAEMQKHFKGKWRGKKLTLELFQHFFLRNIFGWRHMITGLRRFMWSYFEVPRKHGKSFLAGIVGLYMYVCDHEGGPEVYIAATTKEQGDDVLFKTACAMVNSHNGLKNKCSIKYNTIWLKDDPVAMFKPLSATIKNKDGLNTHCGLVDELHAHPSPDLYNVIDSSTTARDQSLMFMITTAGRDLESLGWDQHQYADNVLRGVVEDDNFFGMIYQLDEKDNWTDPDVWLKANPGLGVIKNYDKLAAKVHKAKNQLTMQPEVKQKDFNIWNTGGSKYFDMRDWTSRKCKRNLYKNAWEDWRCYAGLDLSATDDLTALALTFIGEGRYDGYFYTKSWFWTPQAMLAERERIRQFLYEKFINRGHLTPIHGKRIDYKVIFEKLLEVLSKYDVQDIGLDQWASQPIVKYMEEEDTPLVRVSQSFKGMSAPTKETERLMKLGKLLHDGNSVMSWCLGNTVVIKDNHDNIKPVKGKSSDKIDGAIALIISMSRVCENILDQYFEGEFIG